jgi:hypothetical protein
MAAITPNNVRRENEGSTNLIIAEFAAQTINDTDTWASGITGIKRWWFGPNNNPTTQASAGIHVSNSSGTFTFFPGENGATGFLFVQVAG